MYARVPPKKTNATPFPIIYPKRKSITVFHPYPCKSPHQSPSHNHSLDPSFRPNHCSGLYNFSPSIAYPFQSLGHAHDQDLVLHRYIFFRGCEKESEKPTEMWTCTVDRSVLQPVPPPGLGLHVGVVETPSAATPYGARLYPQTFHLGRSAGHHPA